MKFCDVARTRAQKEATPDRSPEAPQNINRHGANQYQATSKTVYHGYPAVREMVQVQAVSAEWQHKEGNALQQDRKALEQMSSVRRVTCTVVIRYGT